MLIFNHNLKTSFLAPQNSITFLERWDIPFLEIFLKIASKNSRKFLENKDD